MVDLPRLKRIVRDLRGAKNNQTIKDLDVVATEFGCSVETTSASENRIYYSPFRDPNPARVTVAIPHRGKVKMRYVQYFIGMLEDVVARLEQVKKEQEGGDPDE